MVRNAPPLVYVVIVNWNRCVDTLVCVESIYNSDYPNYEIIVVDNSSTDKSITYLKGKYPNLRVLLNKSNLGFGKGCNVGIKAALAEGADFVWLINNDAQVAQNTLSSMVERAQSDPNVGIVGSPLYYPQDCDAIQAWGGGRIQWFIGRAINYNYPVSEASLDFITGASMLLSVSMLHQIGLFDEVFFMYFEDADLCIRAKAAGWALALAINGPVIHYETKSLGKKSPLLRRYYNYSAIRFFWKHDHVASGFLGCFLRMLKYCLKASFQEAMGAAAGIFWAIKDISSIK